MQKHILLLAVIFACSFFLLGCVGNGEISPGGQMQNQTTNESHAPSSQTQIQPATNITPPSDPELRQIYENSLLPQLPKTTLENVKSAFYSGELSRADYVVLLFRSIYEPESIPAEYRGEPLDGYDISRDWMLAIETWGELSESQKERILPWISLPDGSVPKVASGYAPKNLPQTDVVSLAAAGSSRTARFAGPAVYIEYAMAAIPGKVSVRERILQNHTQAEKDALDGRVRILKQGAIDAYPKFKSLFGFEPTEEIYVYIEDIKPGVLGKAGMFDTTGDPVTRCRVIIDMNQTKSEERTKDTLAHELFHCFQYYIPLRNFTDPDESWLTEATAVWSENYVYPSANFEQERLPMFFRTRDQPFVQNGSLKEYADYPFFLFLEQYSSANDIVKVLKEAKTKKPKSALTSLPNFDNRFAEYTLWNWNREPVRAYQDTPNFPAIDISGEALSIYNLKKDDKATYFHPIAPGAGKYVVLIVSPAQGIEKINITFPNPDDKKHQKTLLVRINGVWHDEDMLGVPGRTFCLNRPDEKADAIIVVLDNSDLNADYDSAFDVDTNGECPRQIGGTTRISWDFQVQGKDIQATYTQQDTLQYDSEDDEYVLKSRTMSCSYSDTTNIDDPVMPMHGQMVGSGTYTEEYPDPSEAPLKMRLKPEMNRVDFRIDPDKKNGSWVHYTGSINGVPFEEDGDCSSPAPLPGYVELEMDKYLTGDRLHGQESLTTNAFTSNLEFDYAIPEIPIAPVEE